MRAGASEAEIQFTSDAFKTWNEMAARWNEKERLAHIAGEKEWAARIAPQPQPLPKLTDSQAVALLKMTDFKRRGSTLCRGVAKTIERESGAKPTWLDYVALKGLGLCFKPENSKWHVHTDRGAKVAREIAQSKAKEMNLHLFVEADHEKATATFKCICGNWRGTFSRGPNGRKSAYNRWHAHVIEATAEPVQTASNSLTFDLSEMEMELCDKSPVGQHQYSIKDNFARCIHCGEASEL